MSWPSPEGLPDPGIEPVSLTSPALGGRFFTNNTTWGSLCVHSLLDARTTLQIDLGG